MKYNELFRKLREYGWQVSKEAKKHTIYKKGDEIIVVPRHPSKEVPKGTCESILKKAGIK